MVFKVSMVTHGSIQRILIEEMEVENPDFMKV